MRANVIVALVLGFALVSASGCSTRPALENEARRITGGEPSRGRDAIRRFGCDRCHTIPGIPTATGLVGPPLTSMALRVYIAGYVANTPANMVRWIRQPQHFAPKSVMPNMGISDRDARDITAYLYTLR